MEPVASSREFCSHSAYLLCRFIPGRIHGKARGSSIYENSSDGYVPGMFAYVLASRCDRPSSTQAVKQTWDCVKLFPAVDLKLKCEGVLLQPRHTLSSPHEIGR